MRLYYEILDEGKVLYSSEIFDRLKGEDDVNYFWDLLNQETLNAFTSHYKFEEFMQFIHKKIEDEFGDISELQVYLNFIDDKDILNYSITIEDDKVGVIDFINKGVTNYKQSRGF